MPDDVGQRLARDPQHSAARLAVQGTGVPGETYLTSSRPMLCAQAASERSAASSVRPSSGEEASPSSASLASASASRLRAGLPQFLRGRAPRPSAGPRGEVLARLLSRRTRH